MTRKTEAFAFSAHWHLAAALALFVVLLPAALDVRLMISGGIRVPN